MMINKNILLGFIFGVGVTIISLVLFNTISKKSDFGRYQISTNTVEGSPDFICVTIIDTKTGELTRKKFYPSEYSSK